MRPESQQNSSTSSSAPPVHRIGELAGLSEMIASLIEANLTDRPKLWRLAQGRPRRVLITAKDLDVHVRVRIGDGRVEVAEGRDPKPHLWIYTDSASLMELPAAQLRFGLPDLTRPTGRAVLGAIGTGKLKVRGVLRLGLLSRIQRLLSVS